VGHNPRLPDHVLQDLHGSLAIRDQALPLHVARAKDDVDIVLACIDLLHVY